MEYTEQGIKLQHAAAYISSCAWCYASKPGPAKGLPLNFARKKRNRRFARRASKPSFVHLFFTRSMFSPNARRTRASCCPMVSSGSWPNRSVVRVEGSKSGDPAAFSSLPPSTLLLHREHGHGLSVGLNTAEDHAKVSDAKDQDPARQDEEIYPVVVLGGLPEYACTRARVSCICKSCATLTTVCG